MNPYSNPFFGSLLGMRSGGRTRSVLCILTNLRINGMILAYAEENHCIAP